LTHAIEYGFRTQAKLADIDNKIRSLRQMKAALTRLVGACERRKKTNGCPILDSLEQSRDLGVA
jgi:hypothetical protein